MKVFVLNSNKQPLTPCRVRRAHELMKAGKAAVFRKFPFTIILKYEVVGATPRPLRVKIDPGSKTTGFAVVDDSNGKIPFAMEVEHRGHFVKLNMDGRRSVRKGRRSRNTRHREARFNNRTRVKGWLPPSLNSRVCNVITWVSRLNRLLPVGNISVELVKFDMQKMQNPGISGIMYQQGTLAGYEIREYLLEKWNRKCAYCGKEGVPLEVEHILAKSKGGTNRISNLTLSCRSCNDKKDNLPITTFLKKKPEILQLILDQAKVPLKDAAAVNITRKELVNRLRQFNLPIETASGALTKMNRIKRGLQKEHWIDAACVGESTPEFLKVLKIKPLLVRAYGHGCRQMCRMNKYGFPITKPKAKSFKHGFKTGDIVRSNVTNPKRKTFGVHFGRISVNASSICVDGYYVNPRTCNKIHNRDGYGYSN